MKTSFGRVRLGDTFAATAGYHSGKMFIFVEEDNGNMGFIISPTMVNETISKEKFEFGITNAILDYVERLPRSVRSVTRAKYEENKRELRSSE